METETKKALNEADLANFTGSENWYRHWLGKSLYTDGVKYVADQAGAYWLIDEIAISQTRAKVRAEDFQCWTLKVDLEKHKAVLTCDDGNGNVVFTKRIGYTDFALAEIKFYAPTTRSCCQASTDMETETANLFLEYRQGRNVFRFGCLTRVCDPKRQPLSALVPRDVHLSQGLIFVTKAS